ncbi:hypothetical protein F5884DRAFT_818159 [Xylogone sp. PMI_703]|nr:hypothetical protein F5884DRAFT_818159 [Xylogone sp. PMI_703]
MVLKAIHSWYTQWFPPHQHSPRKTSSNLVGRVFLVTGGNSGVGFELIKILYPTGAKIYMAGRSRERCEEAIKLITANDPSKAANLRYLFLDLDDLTTIKASAAAFREQESRLDILWNNAGVGGVPPGWKTKQGIEKQLGTNCVGPLLFTTELIPLLQNTAKNAPKDSVRIVWTSSWLAESMSPKGGIDFKELELSAEARKDSNFYYATSKVGNWMLAHECARRYGNDGIISIVQNPGNLNSLIYKHVPRYTMALLKLVLHDSKLGDIGAEENGGLVIPWGRFLKRHFREDIYKALDEGKGREFWSWCEDQWQPYIQ